MTQLSWTHLPDAPRNGQAVRPAKSLDDLHRECGLGLYDGWSGEQLACEYTDAYQEFRERCRGESPTEFLAWLLWKERPSNEMMSRPTGCP